jgi:hypothetical protein
MIVNIYVTDDIKKQWPNYEFVGKTFKLKDGKTYMRAYSKTFNRNHLYCFQDNWFWHDESPSTLAL